jgi:hypothetical protein
MDSVKFLAPIGSKACHLEDREPQSIGEFLQTLCVCAGLDDDAIQLFFEHIVSDLVDAELLTSCEFHEGLSGLLSGEAVIELLIEAFGQDDPDKLSQAIASLYGGGQLKPAREGWRKVRSKMSALDFRKLLAQMAELACDKVHNIACLLSEVFRDDEEYEFAETLRLVLDSHWILDILPASRKAARKVLYGKFVEPFGFTEKIVEDFTRDFLRLGPEKDAGSDSSSTDSDIESMGSLNEFVVDSNSEDEDEEEEEEEDESSEESEFSDDSYKRKRSKRVRSVTSSDS